MVDVGEMETATLNEQLEAFFEQHDSSRLGEIDLIIDSYRGREHEIMRDVRSEYGLTDRTASLDVWVEGVGTVNEVPLTALRRSPGEHRSNHGQPNHLVPGDEVIVDLRHGKTARGVVRGSGQKLPSNGSRSAQRRATAATPPGRNTRSTGGSPVGYTALSAAAYSEGQPSANGGRPLAASRLVGMMEAFKEDVKRLANEKAHLAAAERRRVSEEARIEAEREALRVAVAQTRQLRFAEEAGLRAERARLEEAIRVNEAERAADAARLSEERLVLQHAVRAMELARGMRSDEYRLLEKERKRLAQSHLDSAHTFAHRHTPTSSAGSPGSPRSPNYPQHEYEEEEEEEEEYAMGGYGMSETAAVDPRSASVASLRNSRRTLDEFQALSHAPSQWQPAETYGKDLDGSESDEVDEVDEDAAGEPLKHTSAWPSSGTSPNHNTITATTTRQRPKVSKPPPRKLSVQTKAPPPKLSLPLFPVGAAVWCRHAEDGEWYEAWITGEIPGLQGAGGETVYACDFERFDVNNYEVAEGDLMNIDASEEQRLRRGEARALLEQSMEEEVEHNDDYNAVNQYVDEEEEESFEDDIETELESPRSPAAERLEGRGESTASMRESRRTLEEFKSLSIAVQHSRDRQEQQQQQPNGAPAEVKETETNDNTLTDEEEEEEASVFEERVLRSMSRLGRPAAVYRSGQRVWARVSEADGDWYAARVTGASVGEEGSLVYSVHYRSNRLSSEGMEEGGLLAADLRERGEVTESADVGPENGEIVAAAEDDTVEIDESMLDSDKDDTEVPDDNSLLNESPEAPYPKKPQDASPANQSESQADGRASAHTPTLIEGSIEGEHGNDNDAETALDADESILNSADDVLAVTGLLPQQHTAADNNQSEDHHSDGDDDDDDDDAVSSVSSKSGPKPTSDTAPPLLPAPSAAAPGIKPQEAPPSANAEPKNRSRESPANSLLSAREEAKAAFKVEVERREAAAAAQAQIRKESNATAGAEAHLAGGTKETHAWMGNEDDDTLAEEDDSELGDEGVANDAEEDEEYDGSEYLEDGEGSAEMYESDDVEYEEGQDQLHHSPGYDAYAAGNPFNTDRKPEDDYEEELYEEPIGVVHEDGINAEEGGDWEEVVDDDDIQCWYNHCTGEVAYDEPLNEEEYVDGDEEFGEDYHEEGYEGEGGEEEYPAAAAYQESYDESQWAVEKYVGSRGVSPLFKGMLGDLGSEVRELERRRRALDQQLARHQRSRGYRDGHRQDEDRYQYSRDHHGGESGGDLGPSEESPQLRRARLALAAASQEARELQQSAESQAKLLEAERSHLAKEAQRLAEMQQVADRERAALVEARERLNNSAHSFPNMASSAGQPFVPPSVVAMPSWQQQPYQLQPWQQQEWQWQQQQHYEWQQQQQKQQQEWQQQRASASSHRSATAVAHAAAAAAEAAEASAAALAGTQPSWTGPSYGPPNPLPSAPFGFGGSGLDFMPQANHANRTTSSNKSSSPSPSEQQELTKPESEAQNASPSALQRTAPQVPPLKTALLNNSEARSETSDGADSREGKQGQPLSPPLSPRDERRPHVRASGDAAKRPWWEQKPPPKATAGSSRSKKTGGFAKRGATKARESLDSVEEKEESGPSKSSGGAEDDKTSAEPTPHVDGLGGGKALPPPSNKGTGVGGVGTYTHTFERPKQKQPGALTRDPSSVRARMKAYNDRQRSLASGTNNNNESAPVPNESAPTQRTTTSSSSGYGVASSTENEKRKAADHRNSSPAKRGVKSWKKKAEAPKEKPKAFTESSVNRLYGQYFKTQHRLEDARKRAAVEKHPTLSPDKGGDEPWHDRRWRLNQERLLKEEQDEEQLEGTGGENDENVKGGNGDSDSSPLKDSQGDKYVGGDDQKEATSPSPLEATKTNKSSHSPDAASPVSGGNQSNASKKRETAVALRDVETILEQHANQPLSPAVYRLLVSSLAQGPLSSPALRNHAVVETLRRRLAFGFLPSSGPKSTSSASSSRASPTRQLKLESNHRSLEKNHFGSGNAGATSPSNGHDPASPTISPLSSPEGSRPITEADIGSRRAAASAALASDRIAKALAAKARPSTVPGNGSKDEGSAENSKMNAASQHVPQSKAPRAGDELDEVAASNDAWVIRPPLKVTPRRRPPAPPTRLISADTTGSEAEEVSNPAEGAQGAGGGGGPMSVHAAARRPRTVKPRTTTARATPEGKLAAAYSAKMMAIARSRRPVSPPTNLRSEAS